MTTKIFPSLYSVFQKSSNYKIIKALIEFIDLSLLQRYFDMIREQRNKLDYELSQQDLPIQFQVGYQYVSDRLALSIFKHVTDDFILPAYIQRYFQKAQKWDQLKNQHVLKYKIIDQKFLKKTNGQMFDFLQQDRKQFQRIKKISIKNSERKINEQNQKDAIRDIFIFQEEVSFINAWKQGLLKIKSILENSNQEGLKKSIKNKKQIKTILFQAENNTKDSTNKGFFLLIRCQENIKNIDEICIEKIQQRSQQQRQQKDFIIQLDKESTNVHQIFISFRSKSVQITKQKFAKVNQNNLKDPKVKLIEFKIKGMNQFIGIPPRKETVFMECEPLDYKNVKNQIGYFFKGFQFQKDKKFGQKHYNLAFQGGGAKGLAYVGAYKALKQKKIDEEQIRIRSIMGSSAGGITAIAASTGISYRQIEQFCYKMDGIPKEDKIDCEDEAFDQYGNKITFPRVEAKLRELFVSFGVLNEQTFNQIAKLLKEKINDIGQEFMNYLKVAAPSIADILDSEKKVQKTEGWLFWKKKTLKHQINWDGVFLHGAIMKGQSIYKIAAECLVKYLLKISYKPLFKQKLEDAFINYQQKSQKLDKIDTNKIQSLLTKYKQLLFQILSCPIQNLFGEIQRYKQDEINFSMICVLNKIITLINLSDTSEKLSIIKLKISKKLNYSQKFEYKRLKLIKIISKIIQRLKTKLNQNNLDQQLHNLSQKLNQNKIRENQRQISTIQYFKKIINKQNDFLSEMIKLQKYLNEGIFNQKNEKDSIAYYFKFMYFYTQVEDQLQAETQQRQYCSIQLKLRKLKNIERILLCQTYDLINAETNIVNFLNHKHFTQKQENTKENIIQYISKILDESYNKNELALEKIKSLIKNQQGKQNLLSEQQFQKKITKIGFIEQLCDVISKNFRHKQVQKDASECAISRKNRIFQELIKEASKITMKEYYNLNPIQVTCTSVDLDNKILRFFNHKTTPNLPICRAVQMTGSFPFAFKALRWKQQWGYYYVHHEDKKVAINIVGHEFTDGGLLANFPVKYFDNKIIRSCYFSHSLQKHYSIMLGFGLDALNEGSYQQSSQELQKEHKQNIQKQIAFKQVQKHFTTWFKLKQGIKIFFNSRWLNLEQKEEEWESFNIKLLEQIPILRFMTKIFSSYPNADRNLNLQAFSQQIMVQTTDVSTINIDYMVIINTKDKKEKEKIKNKQWKNKIKRSFEEFKLFKNVIQNKTQSKQVLNNQPRWSQVFNRIEKCQLSQRQIDKSVKKGFEILFGSDNLPSNGFSQQFKSQLLIKMFLIALKTNAKNNSNKIIIELLSDRYIYFSFISKHLEKQNHQLLDTSLQSQIKGVKKQSNLKNMHIFFKHNNFKEIQKRGDFYQFKKQYLRECEINDLDINYQIEMRKIKQKHKQNFQLIENEVRIIEKQHLLKKQKIWKIIQQKLNANPQANLFDFQLIDITCSYKRMIKYLYLQIKGSKIMDKQKIKKYFGPQDSNLKSILMQNYQKYSFLNKREKTRDYKQLISPKSQDYLTFNQIFQFLCFLKDHGVSKDDKQHKIQFPWQFQQYLQNLKNKQPMHRSRQKVLFCLDLYTQNIQQRSLESISSQLNQNSAERTIIRYKLVEGLCQKKANKNCEKILHSQEISEIAISKMKQQSINQHLHEILHEKSKQQIGQFTLFLCNNLLFKKDNPIFDNSKGFSLIQQGLLNYFYYKTIKKYFENKDATKINSQFSMKHKAFVKDIQYFFSFLRKLIVLVADYQYLYTEQNTIQQKKSHQLFEEYTKIYSQLIIQYEQMVFLPENEITLQKLEETFLIKYDHLSKIISIMRKIVEDKSLKQLRKIKQKQILLQKIDSKLFLIAQVIIEFNSRKCFLPLFAEDWHQLIKINYIDFFTKFRLFANEDNIYKKNQRIICSIIQNKRNKKLIRKIKNKGDTKPNVHLIIQGVPSSNEAFCAYFNQIQHSVFDKIHNGSSDKKQISSSLSKEKIKSNQKQTNFNIKIITSTTLFGFLMCLGQDVDEIRKDMYRTRNYLFEMFNCQKILESYEQHPPSSSLNDYNTLAQHYKIQVLSVMKIFEEEYQKQSGNISYLKKFNEIRNMVHQQQLFYHETCNQMLDAAAEEIQEIQDKFLSSQRANEIAKKFGFDYTCNFNKRHQYGKYNKQCKAIFNEIMVEYYEQFGSLISAITCNFINDKIPFTINLNNVQSFTKGLMISRIMTIYKLKGFIFEKLEEYGFPYDITLKQFYDRCKNKIIINFMVVNMTKKRMEFLNKITTPKMPVWAAIMAASSLPSLHRCFQSEKQWENLQGLNFKAYEMVSFFKERQVIKGKKNLYNSSMLISSIPMQLLTNNTFINKLKQLACQSLQQKQNLNNLSEIGFAFNPTPSQNLFHMKIQKKYFNLSLGIIRLAKKLMFDYHQLIVTSKQKKHRQEHYNRSYDVNTYNPIKQLKILLFQNTATSRIFQTLVESNDNLVMKWYFNKLIRLPIKIGTLSFNQAVDQNVFKKNRLKVPSEKAKDSLLRSYQITKTFIQNVENRFKCNKLQYNQIRSKSAPQRFLVKLRAEFIEKTDSFSGFSQQYIKVVILNHSKWNQNMYNNLVIEYKAQLTSQFKRCQNSEIIWKNQQGPTLLVKFYYIHYKYQPNKDQMISDQDYFTSENSRIIRSKFILDFGEIVKYSHKNSYDYQFSCGRNEQQEQIPKNESENKKDDKKQLYPKKLNGIKVDSAEGLPKMIVSQDLTVYPQNKYCEEYIKDSIYKI